MSKHPIPDWLRSQYSRIEDEVQKLGPCGVFTQMRTVTQTYFEQQAEAVQPPAFGGELKIKTYECELPVLPEAVTSEAFHMVKLDDHRAQLAPLKAELEQLKSDIAAYKASRERLQGWIREEQLKNVHLKARRDELEDLLRDINDAPGGSQFKKHIDAALYKPAGSEQAPPLEIPSRTIKLSGCELTEADLLESAVRAVRGNRRNTLPRWALVRDAFCVGSGVGTALCRRFGFDPEEILKS